MEDQRGCDRRQQDRRVRQWTSEDGWDGIERRKDRDRRTCDRRIHSVLEEIPPELRERELKLHERRARERSRERELKLGREEKQLRLLEDRRREKIR